MTMAANYITREQMVDDLTDYFAKLYDKDLQDAYDRYFPCDGSRLDTFFLEDVADTLSDFIERKRA